MLKLVFLIVGLLLLSLAVPDLYRVLNARQPAVITCEQFARQRPSAVWLRITGCELDYMSAGFRESGGRIHELLFPVRPAGHPRTEPASLVAATTDARALAIAQGTMGAGREPDQEQFLVMMLRIVTTLGAARQIEGVARAGLLERLRARRMLSGLSSPVAPGAVLVDLNARPRILVPAVVAGAGVVALLIATMLVLRRRAPRAVATGAPAGAAAPTEAAGVRHRVLLLALPPGAGPDAIEHAPPLGGLDSVRAVVERHVSGLRFDDANRAAVSDGNGSIAIDLGRDNTVHTAVVDAQGDRGTAELQRLLSETGWRAYAPRSGSFVELAQLYGAGTSIAN
jgi:hypothetical protein